MKCQHCGSWTEVIETRKVDRGHTLRRTRKCGNECPRFVTYEVYAPIYKNDPPRVRQAVNAAEARALRYKRNREIRQAIAKGVKKKDLAAAYNITLSMVEKIGWGRTR